MSLARLLNVPEVEMETSKLVNRLLHLCQGYRQVQMRCFSEELNLPVFGRLFELIRELEMRYIDEIVRFQVFRGQKVTWFDVTPVKDLEQGKLLEIISTIFEMEKDIHNCTIRIYQMSINKGCLPFAFLLQDRIIPRQVKVLLKRANQLRDLSRSVHDPIPFTTGHLKFPFEVEKLERRLRLEMVRREEEHYYSNGLGILGDKEISLISPII